MHGQSLASFWCSHYFPKSWDMLVNRCELSWCGTSGKQALHNTKFGMHLVFTIALCDQSLCQTLRARPMVQMLSLFVWWNSLLSQNIEFVTSVSALWEPIAHIGFASICCMTNIGDAWPELGKFLVLSLFSKVTRYVGISLWIELMWDCRKTNPSHQSCEWI